MSPVKSDLLKIDAIDIFCNYAYFYDCLQGVIAIITTFHLGKMAGNHCAKPHS